MALPVEMQRPFRLYVTHVDCEGPFLKISGQLDKQSACMVETLIESARDSFEKGIGTVPPAAILEGIICAAKYKDGAYYRAKIISTSNLSSGLVGVHFIDYGNKDIISLSTIRFLENYDPLLLQLRGQATDYYLASIMHPSARWEEPMILKLQSLLCYSEYPTTIKAQTRSIPIISILFQGNDLSEYLIAHKYGISVPLAKQEMLMQMTGENMGPLTNWPTNYHPESTPFTEHVPFLTNQNFPSNPASAMRLQQNAVLPMNAFVPPPSVISQRLVVNKTSRTTPSVNLRAPIRQPQQAIPAQMPPSPGSPVISSKPASPKKMSKTYKSRLLEVNSQHKVFISYAEEGPELFAVQLMTDAKKLQDMMDEINRQPHRSLTEPPMIGTVCLGRMSGDRIICRAIVMNLSGSQCKLFFVDFGDTEMVSYYDIFDIPEEFVKPNVFALRFCLSGVKNLQKGPHLNEAFKQLANGKVMTLKVVPPEGPPLIQYGELYLDSKNILDMLMTTVKDTVQFKWLDMLQRGSKHSVLVSYVDSCLKFFIQPSSTIDDLNAVMDAVKIHCENSASPGELPVNSACCAKFPDDGNWYRARVRSIKGNKVTVAYVDYGNEQEVDVSDLRTITPSLITLPAQALKCALKGFEDKPVETKTSNQLEMLALEKTLIAHIVGVLSNDTMLVTLVDDTVSPPLDVARRMNQLSQPRNYDAKPTTPNRKEGSEPAFSSPEGGSDDGKKGFRREKSFKEDRRPPREGGDDFGQRGGSFRGRENREGFDRSGPGRHSEKFAGRPDKGERRGGKPWENNGQPQERTPISASDDTWDENPAQSAPAPPANTRPFRDKRKPREQLQPEKPDRADKPAKPGWRKPEGPRKGKDGETGSRNTIQDRLTRENKPGENITSGTNNDDWESYRQRDRPRQDRPDRRENNFGEKREPFQKREFRDNREERQPFQKRELGEGDNRREGFQKRDFGDREGGFQKRDFGDREGGFQKRDFGDREGGFQKRDFGDREGGFQKRDFGEKREGFQKRDFKDRNDRTRSNFNPRDRAERSFGSDGGKSDKSFGSKDGGRNKSSPPYKPRRFENKELPSPVPLETAFLEPSVDPNTQHEVSVTWIVSPDSFYTQILSLQPKFLEMMHSIPEVYKGVKPYSGAISVGASVLARYPEDGVLYRATVVSVQPFGKFIVQYIDFGNKFLVDARDIWQLDNQLMELPKMAVHCSLLGVAPLSGEWKADKEIDLCFNAPRYQCVFQDCSEGKYRAALWNNGVSVAAVLVERGLAAAAAADQAETLTLKDEAIDLTIIPGQYILGKVTYVESLEKFYVQLDLDKAALVESAIDSFDSNLLTPLTAADLAAGVHCTARRGGQVHRAIVTAVDGGTVTAQLPDYGTQITTSLEDLMILPRELSVYYYQSLACRGRGRPASVTAGAPSVDELRGKLTGRKLLVHIDEVDGVELVTTLHDLATGEKIQLFPTEETAVPQAPLPPPRAVLNYNWGLASVAAAESLAGVGLQAAGDADKLAALLDDLYAFYEEGSPEPLSSFEPGVVCAAKSADGNWYRARLAPADPADPADPATTTVFFLDYGNSETVPKDNVKKLDPKFNEPNCLALIVGLGLVPISDDAVAKLQEWTGDKEVQVTVSFGDDGWLANLHLDGVDLSVKLVNENLAAPPSTTNEQTEAAVEPISLPEGCVQVYISHIDSPGQFWLQMADKVDAIEEIQAELQEKVSTYPELENREMGTLCVAKYSADDQWYRAVILDSDADITTVRFIDYGNTDVLDNAPGLLKELPASLGGEGAGLAVKASVNAVPSGTGQWSEAAADLFSQLVGDTSLPVAARVVLKDVTTYVDIFVRGENLTDKIVAEGHATRSEDNECGDLPSCFASHVNSPSEFWIQLESATAELQSMENAIVDAENFPELTDKEEGVICAAKYPEDGEWYRAQIIVEGSEGTEVLFMDYGNASIATELRSLPDELKLKPALSRKCALQKPREIKSWSRRSEVRFNELAAEGATIFKVQFIASGDISIVELYLDGKSVTEELVSLCEPETEDVRKHPHIERPTPVGQDLQTTGKICYVNSHDEFYIHLDDSSDDIGKVMEKMIDAPEYEAATELKVGSLCAGFWAEDEQWYRAKILEFCDVGSHVQFIDYGNKAKCEEFRQLPEELSAMEPLAKCCRLAGLPEDAALYEKAKNKLDDLVIELTTFQIEFLDSTKEPALVRLNLDGEDITNVLLNSVKSEDVAETKETVAGSEKFADSETDAVEDKTKTAEKLVDEIVDAATAEQLYADEKVAGSEKDVVEDKTKTVGKLLDEIVDAATAKKLDAAEKVAGSEKDVEDKTVGKLVDEIVDAATTEKVDVKSRKSSEENNEVVSNVVIADAAAEKNTETKETEVTEDIEASKESEEVEKETKTETIETLKNEIEEVLTVEKDTKENGLNSGETQAEDLDSSLNEANESIDSSNTVIENKSFEANPEQLDEADKDDSKTADSSSETLESSSGTLKSHEDDSKESINTDTGYTSSGDKSPEKIENGKELSPEKLQSDEISETISAVTTEQ